MTSPILRKIPDRAKGRANEGDDRFCAALFLPSITEKSGNTANISGFFYFVWTKNASRKTASHRRQRDFCVKRGDWRRNTGHVFRAQATMLGAKRSCLRLSYPSLARPKGPGRSSWLYHNDGGSTLLRRLRVRAGIRFRPGVRVSAAFVAGGGSGRGSLRRRRTRAG